MIQKLKGESKAVADINFTLNYEFLVGLFSEDRNKAFGKLMEAIMNQVLKTESTEQLGAENYERSKDRRDYRNGTRKRELVTRIGKIELDVPRHRDVPFKTVLFENYQRNEQALIATMMEMVVQGVSTRNISKITEELCGARFSKSAVSDICKDLDEPVKKFRDRPLITRYPFVMLDAIYIKVREDHRIRSKAVLIAIGINTNGQKEVLGFSLCDTEKELTWKEFIEGLKSRGLHGVDIVISDSHQGLIKAITETLPGAAWQRCQVHLMRNVMDKTPKKYQYGLKAELNSMFQAVTIQEARTLRDKIYEDYQDVAPKAMQILDDGFEHAMTIMVLPSKYRRSLRTTNIIERENREIRRRENVIQIFPNASSAERLIGAILMDDNNDWIGKNRVFHMGEYLEQEVSIMQKITKLIA